MSLLSKIKGQRNEIKISRAGQARAYKFKPGKTVVSFLPLHGDLDKPFADRDIYRKFGMHYIKNVKGENVVAVGDKSLTYDGETCPVRDGLVDMIRYANSIGDDELAEAAKKSIARPAYLFNLMVHQDPDKKAEENPVMAQFSESLADQLFSILEEYLADGGDDLLRWNDRLMFVIEREGTTMTDTRYKIYPAAKRISINADVMTKAVNLEEYVQAQFTDSVQKALTYIANATGRSVSGSAIAAALTGGSTATAALAAPVETVTEVEDLLAAAPSAARTADAPALSRAVAEDAVFEDLTSDTAAPSAEPAPAASSSSSAEDLLAEIDSLAA